MKDRDLRASLSARQATARAQFLQASQAVLVAEENLRTARARAHQLRGTVDGLTQAIADLDAHARNLPASSS
jgi:ribosomal protein L17